RKKFDVSGILEMNKRNYLRWVFHSLVFFDPLGITIWHKIQSDVMLKERFEPGEHQREPLSRVGHLFHKFVARAGEAGFRDTDERCPMLLARKYPFYGGGIIV